MWGLIVIRALVRLGISADTHVELVETRGKVVDRKRLRTESFREVGLLRGPHLAIDEEFDCAWSTVARLHTGQDRNWLALPGRRRRRDAVDAQVAITDPWNGDHVDRHALLCRLRCLVDGLADIFATIREEDDPPPAAER